MSFDREASASERESVRDTKASASDRLILRWYLQKFDEHLEQGDAERAASIWSRLSAIARSVDASEDEPFVLLVSGQEVRPQRPTRTAALVFDCASRYWNSTGDPLGALRILNDMPEDALAGELADRFTVLVQEVADDMEREQLWERVYPPELPITERWKEMAGTDTQGRVLPAVLVNADEERALLRVGEWLEDAGPATFEVVVQGDERNRLREFNAGAFIVVTFDENDVLVSARAQEGPHSSPSPVDLLKELKRRWNCLTHSP